MITIHCVVERVTYQNAENGYSVMRVSMKRYKELTTIVGSLPGVSVGTVLRCSGDWTVDKKYGNEFAVTSWEEEMPETVYGIERYLACGMVEGIGPKYAKMIVDHFGKDTIMILDDNIQRLREVHGIGKKRLENITQSWEKQKEIKDVMIFLQGYGVSSTYAIKIFQQYDKDSIEKVKENPFRLADDINGIGFKTADSIATNMGYEKNDLRRCKSGILYTLNQLASDGHTCADEEQLVAAAVKLLDADEASIRKELAAMLTSEDLIEKRDAIYLPPFYNAEASTAMRLLELVKNEDKMEFCDANFRTLAEDLHIQFNSAQKHAIDMAGYSSVMVLTGGPGTGKTTTLRGMIANFQAYGQQVLLAAPTGRAAKRMTEATGMEAKTIHRLLEFNSSGYGRNDDNKLEGDVLIVDECSMIDIMLMYNLMKAIPSDKMRLVLVGDVDQLPSVGAGNVLRDIIDSKKIPVTVLDEIFRQAQSSRIVMNAHAINLGRFPDISNGRHSDFFFINNDDADLVAKEIVDLVDYRLPDTYEIGTSQIQVLTPMQRGVVGAANLNSILQETLNSNKKGLKRGAISFRLGDRVMQTKNNYEKNVFNGDLGYIEDVDFDEQTLQVDFEGNSVKYQMNELDELTLAYATTIHKSQGSEYPIVVIPVLMNHFMMLQRNLIYTAITRAKKVCVLIGSRKALVYAIHHVTVTERNSKLKYILNPKLSPHHS